MRMNKYRNKPWQNRALAAAKLGWPMRFTSRFAAIAYWNSGVLVPGHLEPLIIPGKVSVLNWNYFMAPYELTLDKCQSGSMIHCQN